MLLLLLHLLVAINVTSAAVDYSFISMFGLPSKSNDTGKQEPEPNRTEQHHHNNETSLDKYRVAFERLARQGQPEEQCYCDRSEDICDLECCCDIDCPNLMKYSFGTCKVLPSRQTSRLCEDTHVNFRSLGGVGCLVVKDNTGRREWFAEQRSLLEVSHLNNLRPEHNFVWTRPNTNVALNETQTSVAEYKSGEPIVLTNSLEKNVTQQGQQRATTNFRLWTFAVANNFRGGVCNSQQMVKYLHDFRSSCHLPVAPTLANFCQQHQQIRAENYFRSLGFFYNNFAEEQYNLIKVQPRENYSAPTWSAASGVCSGAVSKVHYLVHHRGLYGIARVQLQLQQQNLSRLDRFIQQEYSVTFIFDQKVDNKTQKSKKHAKLSRGFDMAEDQSLIWSKTNTNNTERHLVNRTIKADRAYGQCSRDFGRLRAYTFGHNQVHVCQLRVELSASRTIICRQLKQQIAAVLDLESLNHLWVGKYRTASLNQTDDWLPVLNRSSNDQTITKLCPGVYGGIAYEFYRARHGHPLPVQYKLVGASYRLEPIDGLALSCERELKCRLTGWTLLATSVSFVDLTTSVQLTYARPPSIRIELPNDFFYPFMSSRSVLQSSSSSSLAGGWSSPSSSSSSSWATLLSLVLLWTFL